jgi:hypothetical protein
MESRPACLGFASSDSSPNAWLVSFIPKFEKQTTFSPIPFQYLPGLDVELPQQILRFVNQRIMEFVQRFDIPGLSVAIVKNEHLKLAAGSLQFSLILKILMFRLRLCKSKVR